MNTWVGMGFVLAWGMGWHWGRRRESSEPPPELHVLHQRLLHARNLSMRLGEMAQTEQRLADSHSLLEQHLQLKEGVSWMLLNVEHRLHSCGHEVDSETVERMEHMLSSTSKSLRYLIEVGRHPIMTWSSLVPAAKQMHHSLCLILDQKTSTISQTEFIQSSGNEVYATLVINEMIRLAIHNQLPDTFPLQATSEGVSLRRKDLQSVWFQPWEVAC